MTSALNRTPLASEHVALGAKMVNFGGWEMPLAYGSQIEEHHAVRSAAGMFDVSHMLIVDITGPHAERFLRYLLANDVARLTEPGRALYSCMLNPEGGVIDDLIVYAQGADKFRLVVNAACADKDIAWMDRVQEVSGAEISITPRRDLAMIALQGPHAHGKFWAAQAVTLFDRPRPSPFSSFQHEGLMVARTGYTGEDGYEIIGTADRIVSLWRDLIVQGVRPCGLGARDTLRIEAGMNLYGQDMDEFTQPAESALAWTVSSQDPQRDYIGRAAVTGFTLTRQLVGLKLLERGVMRAHMPVRTAVAIDKDAGDGVVTSGTMSPTLGVSIAFARLPADQAIGSIVEVEMRGKWLPARVCTLPFVRHGKVIDTAPR